MGVGSGSDADQQYSTGTLQSTWRPGLAGGLPTGTYINVPAIQLQLESVIDTAKKRMYKDKTCRLLYAPCQVANSL